MTDGDAATRVPEPFWQASGLYHGQPVSLRLEGGVWSASGGQPDLLEHFRILLNIAGYDADVVPPPVGYWIDALEAAARATITGPVVIDDNFTEAFPGGQVN